MSEGALFPSLFSPGWMELVQQTLATLQRGVGGECVVLVGGTGEVIAQTGSTDSVLLEDLLALLLEEATITAQVGRRLGNGTGISLHHYEGNQHQVYVGVSARNPLLLIVVSRQPPPRRLGVVWLFLRRTLQELGRLVPHPGEARRYIGRNDSLTPEQARALGIWLEE